MLAEGKQFHHFARFDGWSRKEIDLDLLSAFFLKAFLNEFFHGFLEWFPEI